MDLVLVTITEPNSGPVARSGRWCPVSFLALSYSTSLERIYWTSEGD